MFHGFSLLCPMLRDDVVSISRSHAGIHKESLAKLAKIRQFWWLSPGMSHTPEAS
jgi:hypothetical protein